MAFSLRIVGIRVLDGVNFVLWNGLRVNLLLGILNLVAVLALFFGSLLLEQIGCLGQDLLKFGASLKVVCEQVWLEDLVKIPCLETLD